MSEYYPDSRANSIYNSVSVQQKYTYMYITHAKTDSFYFPAQNLGQVSQIYFSPSDTVADGFLFPPNSSTPFFYNNGDLLVI